MTSPAVDLQDLAQLRGQDALGLPFLTDVLDSLVRTRSVNPGIYEEAMAARVAEWLEPTGAEVSFVDFEPGRRSVGAVLKGSGDGPTLVLNGHMDTVPIDDESLWRTSPFEPVVADGYMWGRGACDMKAGLTVQIGVAHLLARHRDRLRGTLVLHFAAGEECGEPGTLSLLQHGFVGDYGIVTEPTQLRVATAQRGLAFYRIRIRGRSIHASRAHLGLNPVTRLRPVLEVLERYDADVRAKPHPLLPGGSCTPTVVRAGVKENALADYCDLTLDRRLLPGETVEGELEELRRRLAAIREQDAEFEAEVSVIPHPFEPAEIDPGSGFAARVLDVVAAVTGERGEVWGTPYSSDVRNLVNDAGIEAVTFGPGNVEECHCPNERVSLDDLANAALATAKVAVDLLVEA
ncbi:MAG: ArgE/DapE family deacylase [Thermoleophilia bacterium]